MICSCSRPPDALDIAVPRGEARRRMAALARALLDRSSLDQLEAVAAEAAELVWDEAAQKSAASAGMLVAPAPLVEHRRPARARRGSDGAAELLAPGLR